MIILSFSAYLWWDSQDYLDLDEVNKFYITPFVVFATLGAVMTVVGFLGCCGAIRESKCILGMVMHLASLFTRLTPNSFAVFPLLHDYVHRVRRLFVLGHSQRRHGNVAFNCNVQ